jgi:DNA invertase Pin-like site-specific DNA recombinase
VDIVVVKSVDRLARSLKKFVDFADNCREHDTTIHVVESGIDNSTATGTLILKLLNLLSTFATFKGEQIAQGRKVSQAHRRKEGRTSRSP